MIRFCSVQLEKTLLANALILVADDQPFIALDLAFAVEDAGGMVLGPTASVKEALALIAANPVVGAILDVNLVDGDISPVVEHLIGLGVPIILQTGVGLPSGLAAHRPDLVVHIKPCVSATLVLQLEAMIADKQANT